MGREFDLSKSVDNSKMMLEEFTILSIKFEFTSAMFSILNYQKIKG